MLEKKHTKKKIILCVDLVQGTCVRLPNTMYLHESGCRLWTLDDQSNSILYNGLHFAVCIFFFFLLFSKKNNIVVSYRSWETDNKQSKEKKATKNK